MINKYTPALICGFGAAVLTTIPGIKNIACCLIVPLASMIAIFLYKKVNQPDLKIKTGIGLMLGLITGIIAAVFSSGFDIILTYISRTNDFIESIPQSKQLIEGWALGPMIEESIKLIESMETDIRAKGFSFLYAIMITMSNLIVFGIFGFLGGALGVALINRRKS